MAHEGLRAGEHDGVDHADGAHVAVEDHAVEVELPGRHRCLQQHAVGAGHVGPKALAHQSLEGLYQAADHPEFPGAEAGVAVQFGVVLDAAREHRERGLHRLHEQGIGQARGNGRAVFGVQQLERHVRFRRHALQNLARVELVLAGQDGGHRRTRPAHALGQQGRGQRAELFVAGNDGVPASRRRATRQAIDETADVEPGQARVAGEGEQIKTVFVEAVALRAGQALVRHGVPVVVEEQQGAVGVRHGSTAIAVSTRMQPQQTPVAFVGQQVDEAVGTFAHVAHARVEVG
ncbi:hypothetical protein FQZ97_876610 [compost metagenome]